MLLIIKWYGNYKEALNILSNIPIDTNTYHILCKYKHKIKIDQCQYKNRYRSINQELFILITNYCMSLTWVQNVCKLIE